MDRITAWLDSLQWSAEWSIGGKRAAALEQLGNIARVVARAPYVALGVGQALLMYFWWQGATLDVDVEAVRLSFAMHFVSIQYVGCDKDDLPVEVFNHFHCSWRWRHAAMIPTELGVFLAKHRPGASKLVAEVLADASAVEAQLRRLRWFSLGGWSTSYALNSNSLAFPGPVNRPVWPSADVPLAVFLEAHADVFQQELAALVADGRFDSLYWGGEVSLTQFAPRLDDWQMVSLVKNRKSNDRVCEHAPHSCELLATRPELMQCTAGDVGAAFARLMPGSGLRPHFWNAPRLGFHLGLRTPNGARMHVGGLPIDWAEGRVTVFDDTYVHGVLHEGEEARFLLIGWFCHPCDDVNSLEPPERAEPLCPHKGSFVTS